MKQVTKDEMRDNFLSIFETVQDGEDIVILGDEGKEKLAVIVPYKKYGQRAKGERKLGPLKGRAGFRIKENFKITDEEFLSL
jgi:antitoxin (DNA-binding transcriptional repressor) of toxin-antitoxin stability system